MTVSVIRMNKVVIQDNRETIKEQLEKDIEETAKFIDGHSREVRRNKKFKAVAGIFTFISALALIGADKAHAYPMPQMEMTQYIIDKIKDEIEKKSIEHITREDTLLWKLNDYMSDKLFMSHDFFSNPSVIGMHTTISYIVMSFLVLIISKKGFDMIRAKMMGSSTMGIPELILRILASFVITFLSLKVASLGIGLSGAIIKVFFGNLSTQLIPDVAIGNYFGAVFWLVSYVLMFAILMVRYWIRQISMVLLGLMTPVASMSWVTDGGAMLSTLIKEYIVCLTTPIAQGFILAIGTVLLSEVATIGAVGDIGFFSQVFIGLSTLFLMIIQPEFIRKFIRGSANPIGGVMDIITKMKSTPMKFVKLFK